MRTAASTVGAAAPDALMPHNPQRAHGGGSSVARFVPESSHVHRCPVEPKAHIM